MASNDRRLRQMEHPMGTAGRALDTQLRVLGAKMPWAADALGLPDEALSGHLWADSARRCLVRRGGRDVHPRLVERERRGAGVVTSVWLV